MPGLPELEAQFLEALSALGSALDELMVVGGWCPYLYAKYLWRTPLPPIPTTLDIDLGVRETGAGGDVTVFDQLARAGFAMERLYDEEPVPIEFISRRGNVDLKLEFITSFLTSDDTLNRFLGRELACNRLEAFELLLEHPLDLNLPRGGTVLRVRVPEPAAFLFHKGITFVLRGEEFKRDKDLFYLYFVLRHAPDREALLERLKAFSGHAWFTNFRDNLEDFLGDYTRPGYAVLGRYLRAHQDARTIDREIHAHMERLRSLWRPAA